MIRQQGVVHFWDQTNTHNLTWQKGNLLFEDGKHLHRSHLLISPETCEETRKWGLNTRTKFKKAFPFFPVLVQLKSPDYLGQSRFCLVVIWWSAAFKTQRVQSQFWIACIKRKKSVRFPLSRSHIHTMRQRSETVMVRLWGQTQSC